MMSTTAQHWFQKVAESLDSEEMAHFAGALLQSAGVSRDTTQAFMGELDEVNREEFLAQLEPEIMA